MIKSFLPLLAAFTLSGLSAHAVVLELRPQVTLTGANLTLNDVLASSQGVSADDLAAVIAEAPSLGNAQTWSRDDLATRLPVDLKSDTLEWAGAPACEVDRPAAQCCEHEVRQLITAELAKHLPPNSDFAILEIPNLDTFLIPQGQLDINVELGEGALRHEWADATLQFRYQGQLAVTKSVRFHWAYTRMVWQVTNTISSGGDITPASFQQIETNILKVPGMLEPASDFPTGKVAAHSLPQGKILMENDWVEPLLVTRNDIVTILYDHHGISITVQAKALSDGIRNEVIAVQNLTSHKVFNARVVDQRSLVYDE